MVKVKRQRISWGAKHRASHEEIKKHRASHKDEYNERKLAELERQTISGNDKCLECGRDKGLIKCRVVRDLSYKSIIYVAHLFTKLRANCFCYYCLQAWLDYIYNKNKNILDICSNFEYQDKDKEYFSFMKKIKHPRAKEIINVVIIFIKQELTKKYLPRIKELKFLKDKAFYARAKGYDIAFHKPIGTKYFCKKELSPTYIGSRLDKYGNEKKN